MEEIRKPHKITVVDSDGQELSLTLHWDADIYEWIEAFKVILKWLTFGDELIKEALSPEEEK
jgi:hypothetical protein